ncbi:hypothetical protein [Commensalibacter sp. Nvir]|uniref:hypothetical protein n=1 Tax=Commensalibacter sp. Nvir TaxID=3069817 RepID=UPI0030C7A6CD
MKNLFNKTLKNVLIVGTIISSAALSHNALYAQTTDYATIANKYKADAKQD